MNLQEQIKKIDNEINVLKNEKSLLMKQINDSDIPFLEKFGIWYNNTDDQCHKGDLPSKKISPLLREYFSDMERYQIYGLEYIVEDLNDFIYLTDTELENNYTQEEIILGKKDLEEVLPLLEECYNNKIKSFQCDW